MAQTVHWLSRRHRRGVQTAGMTVGPRWGDTMRCWDQRLLQILLISLPFRPLRILGSVHTYLPDGGGGAEGTLCWGDVLKKPAKYVIELKNKDVSRLISSRSY